MRVVNFAMDYKHVYLMIVKVDRLMSDSASALNVMEHIENTVLGVDILLKTALL